MHANGNYISNNGESWPATVIGPDSADCAKSGRSQITDHDTSRGHLALMSSPDAVT